MNKSNTFSFSSKFEGRLDKAVLSVVGELTRSQVEKAIKNGLVYVDGKPCLKCGTKIKVGQSILVTLDLPTADGPAQNIFDVSLPIIFETERFFAVDKPSGLVVHPGAGARIPTVLDFVLKKNNRKVEDLPDPALYGFVHRLDKDTSGVLLIAKDQVSQRALSKLFENRQVKKTYIAVAHLTSAGLFRTSKRGLIHCWIKRDSKNRLKYKCFPTKVSQSREAVTRYEKLAWLDDLAILILEPVTGRTHQLRSQCEFVKCPIVNDPLYCRLEATKIKNSEIREILTKAKRLMLHALKLEFSDPFTGNKICIKAELPVEFSKIVKILNVPNLDL
ncbi:MAG: RluA family pseudouridine synthase [Deltaproteobacteria bacterium]|nr:RluA family pseudouridine synthase [Deltaproteobacteria bacterium]